MKQELVDLAEQQAEIYSLFSNPNRLQIMWLLKNQELSVGDIAVAIGESMPNTSQYLRIFIMASPTIISFFFNDLSPSILTLILSVTILINFSKSDNGQDLSK